MNGSRFDGWTRRRFGQVSGGIAAAVFGWAALGDAGARKKRRRNKKQKGERGGASCQAADQACVNDGECCSGNCANLPSSEQAVCRRPMCSQPNETCQTHGDCCFGGCFDNIKVCFA